MAMPKKGLTSLMALYQPPKKIMNLNTDQVMEMCQFLHEKDVVSNLVKT